MYCQFAQALTYNHFSALGFSLLCNLWLCEALLLRRRCGELFNLRLISSIPSSHVIMSTIQNLKNFIRHGKQARASNSPHADPTTNISNVHAQQQRHYSPAQQHIHGVTEPNIVDHHQLQHHTQKPVVGGFSVAPIDNQNQVARAQEVAANAAGEHQKIHEQQPQHKGAAGNKKQEYDPSVIERIVAEERESKGKMPKYPGLERWQLVEKMGDGAFSNVYRAKDTQGQYPEVAIKVVRKFEMNNSQVSSQRFAYIRVLFPSRQ